MKNIDYKLFITVVLLMIFGVIIISSVSVYSSFDVTSKMVAKGKIPEAYNYFYLFRSISHIFIALFIMAIITKINSKFFEKYSYIFLGGSVLLLIYTLIKGIEIKGAKGWLIIQGLPFVIQPAEFLKISFIIFLAFLFKKYHHFLKDFQKGFLPYLGIIGILVFIVGLIPDFGTLMILLPVAGIMFFYAGANKKHIASLCVLGVLLFSAVYSLGYYNPEDSSKNNKLGYIKQRVDNFFKSNESLFEKQTEKGDNRTHQTKQGLITIGSGGFWGKGFGQSIQKFGHLPEVQGDFIFAVIVEELGFRGGLILILVYLYIGYRGFYISYNVTDKFQKFASLGITSRILFQAFINIGVNLNVVPLTGVTLPFVSYGGSSLLSLAIGVGILLAISRNVEEKPKYARMNKHRFIF